MARRKSGGDGGGEGTWLNTYADMVTLLLTFFAVLLSMSNTDEQKFLQFIQYFQNPTEEPPAMPDQGGIIIADEDLHQDGIETIDELYQYLTEYVEQAQTSGSQQADDVLVSKNDDVIYIRFNTDVFFKPNQYTLLPESYPILEFIGQGLNSCQDIIKMVTIAGHTADTQVETNISDWRLSGDRAATVAIYLQDEIGFPANKMKIEGYGDQYPVADNSTEEGRKQNRRVEILVVGNDETGSTPDAYDSIKDFYDKNLYPTEGSADDLLTPDYGASASSEPSEVTPTPQPQSDPEPTAVPESAPQEGGETTPAE